MAHRQKLPKKRFIGGWRISKACKQSKSEIKSPIVGVQLLGVTSQTQSVSGFIDNQNEFWDNRIGISNVKNIVDAKKPSDKQIFNQALIDAAALLRRAQNQIVSPAYKQSLGVFIDTLEEIELNSATA